MLELLNTSSSSPYWIVFSCGIYTIVAWSILFGYEDLIASLIRPFHMAKDAFEEDSSLSMSPGKVIEVLDYAPPGKENNFCLCHEHREHS